MWLAPTAGMHLPAAPWRLALSWFDRPGRIGCGGFAVGGLIVGNAKLASQGVTVRIAACHFRSPSHNL